MRRSSQAGFSFIELIVGLAIMSTIATVVTPVLLASLDRARVDATIETFTDLGEAIAAFQDDVDRWPGQLSQLTTPITGSQEHLCGTNYRTGWGSSNEVVRWDGPYLNRMVPSTGLIVPVGRARNQLGRISYPHTLLLHVDSVVVEDALALNERIDGDGDDAVANAVRWTAASADGFVTLSFAVPLSGC